jgi:hypothetical protein
VNPLGKILDFVQEDFDAMQKELEVWRRENHENVIALQREQRLVLHFYPKISVSFACVVGRLLPGDSSTCYSVISASGVARVLVQGA